MFKGIFESVPKPDKGNDVSLNYAEIAKNRKEIEERRRREEVEIHLKKLGKEIEIQEGVEKARRELGREFEHKS